MTSGIIYDKDINSRIFMCLSRKVIELYSIINNNNERVFLWIIGN
jgi:hypothetical protein